MQLESYKTMEGVTQSYLKTFINPLQPIREVEAEELYYEEKKHFIIGDLVDMLITRDISDVYEDYFIDTLEKKPSKRLMSIAHRVYDADPYLSLEDSDNNILIACKEQDYLQTWGEEAILNHIKKGIVCNYHEALILSNDKITVSREEFELSQIIAENIKGGEYTKKYFIINEEENKDIEYQKIVQFTWKETLIKGLLDMVIFDHDNMTIQPIDIKTIGAAVLEFRNRVNRRYDIQAATYSQGLKENYPKYEILPFKFIVESTKRPGIPLVFTMTPEATHIALHGDKKRDIKGLFQLISDYKYHSKLGMWDRTREVIENNGELTFNLWQ